MTRRPEQFDAAIDGFPVVSKETHRRDTLEILATEFAEQVRQGLHPLIDDYVARYPALGEQIQDIFPTVAALEKWKSDKEGECLRRQMPHDFSVKQLGDCRIVREIGRGGMGIVFEARQGESRRPVAVKLLPWRLGANGLRWQERFRREVAIISKLRHRNIVPVYSFGEHDGYSYYVMRLVNGVSLDSIIRRLGESDGVVTADEIARTADRAAMPGRHSRDLHRKSWQGFAQIAFQAAQALRFAHSHGVLHNDVKPANLLLDASGRVLMTDFGVAARTKTEPGHVEDPLMGTLRYMAPERFFGRCDEASDVYALGITLYELATLTPAFEAPDRRRLVELILESQPLRPRKIHPEIPGDLESIILTAMSMDSADRYSSAGEFASDLLRFMNGQRVRAKRSGVCRRAIRRCRNWLQLRNRDRWYQG